jgi:hypothetical protein
VARRDATHQPAGNLAQQRVTAVMPEGSQEWFSNFRKTVDSSIHGRVSTIPA